MPSLLRIERRTINKSLFTQLVSFTQLVDDIAVSMSADQYQWQRTILGHNFSVSRAQYANGEGFVPGSFRLWMHSYEEAQVMLASVLVVVGLWWLVHALLNLVINLVCPLLVVLLAVICVPQLRTPLLGRNYPMLANLLRNILMNMADKIK